MAVQQNHAQWTRSLSRHIAVAFCFFAILFATTALAKGGSSIEVTITGAASGSLANGMLTIRNTDTKAATASAISVALDVRYPSGVTPPPLPAGHASGWYRVATVALSSAQIAAGGIVNRPYSIDTCGGQVAAYPGAKDMRSIARVVVGRVESARSLNYALPAPCPQCGNGIRETGEACDAGSSGGACCTVSCQLVADGSTCSDGDACTEEDQCQAGYCVAGEPIVCDAEDQCHTAGTCNPATGICSSPAKADTTPCDDGNACTQNDVCRSGSCVSGDPLICTATNACLDAACDSTTGACVETAKADGSTCSDGNACTRRDVCVAGACESSDPVICGAISQCHDAGVCNPATGACSNPLRANGAACNDGNGCTQTDTCLSGTCRGANPVVCEALGSCVEASCDPSTGTCDSQPRPDGSECMDNDTCTVGDACQAGECIPGAARDCDDHLTCTDDACDPPTGCGHSDLPTCEGCDAVECAACGAACDDANAQCVAGCWEGFLGCFNGCTSTYCAPFCQVGLGQCINACPSTEVCRQGCDSGNACAANCTEP